MYFKEKRGEIQKREEEVERDFQDSISPASPTGTPADTGDGNARVKAEGGRFRITYI